MEAITSHIFSTENNRELELARQFIGQTDTNVFLTGKAGTGKTTFLKRLREDSPKRMVVVAPTGVAAINAGGVTIHSFFQLPLSPYVPGMQFSESGRKQYSFSKEKKNILRSLDLLVIDEISMVRADLLDAIDSVLRRYKDHSRPFGGVQLLMIGDLQQLSPVVKDSEVHLLKPHYDTFYFFGSHALKQSHYVTIELKTIYRQTDAQFVNILNAIRERRIDNQLLARLNERYIPGFKTEDADGYIRLTTHNHTAQQYNEHRLAALPSPAFTFNAEVKGNFNEALYPAEAMLTLKEGAQVMFIRNDESGQGRYYNGKIGHVQTVTASNIVVRCDDGAAFNVEPSEWTNSRYTLDEATKEIREEIEGIFRQYPLRLAWAITIHKSQGLTFEKAVIDAAASFAHGQVYVALSRCRTLEGMVLATPLRQSAVMTDLLVEDYIQVQEKAATESLSRLESIKEEYFSQLLGDMFDFRNLSYLQKRMLGVCKDFPSGSVVGLAQKHSDILDALNEKVVPVGLKWNRIISGKSYEELCSDEFSERIRKGCVYFLSELETAYGDFLDKMKTIKVENKELLKRYNNIWNDLHLEVETQKLLLRVMSSVRFSTETFLRARQKAVYEASGFVPEELKTSSRKSASKKSSSKESKPAKEDTRFTTFRLYKQGLSVKEIAKERDLHQRTINNHIAHYVAKGMIPVEEFVSQSKIGTITKVVSETGTLHGLAAIKKACPEDISYEEIILVLASLETE